MAWMSISWQPSGPGSEPAPATRGSSSSPEPQGTAGTVATVRSLKPLRVLSVLLVLTSVGYGIWHVLRWSGPLVETVSSCPATRGMQCLVSDAAYAWVYLPLLCLVLCWSFASGANTEAKQGRRRGYFYLVAGVIALVLAWWVSVR